MASLVCILLPIMHHMINFLYSLTWLGVHFAICICSSFKYFTILLEQCFQNEDVIFHTATILFPWTLLGDWRHFAREGR